MCYKWAEDYFNDSNAEVDKEKDEKFVPKTYYGGSSAKANKKDAAKPTAATAEKKPDSEAGQIDLFGGAA